MQVYPQTMINVRMKQRFDINSSKEVMSALGDVEKQLARNGRVVLRASGTEPVVRVMVEGSDAGLVERLSQELADIVRRAAEAAA
jgi:phosphoglucosamine mutase